VTRTVFSGAVVVDGTGAGPAEADLVVDGGTTPLGNNLRELDLMVQCGMSPMDAIMATTRSAAELMGLDSELGTLEPGKRADPVVVDGDPLEVATPAPRVSAVYQDGVRVV